jgi:putative endonuclease
MNYSWRLNLKRFRCWWRRPWAKRFQQPIPLIDAQGQELDSEGIGRLGEDLAAEWLWAVGGGTVLYRNFSAHDGGEIDIVLRDGPILAFIEVKTRTSLAFGRPAEAVNRAKRRLIIRGAKAWRAMLHFRIKVPYRFDILEIVLTPGAPPDIYWMKYAFFDPQAP